MSQPTGLLYLHTRLFIVEDVFNEYILQMHEYYLVLLSDETMNIITLCGSFSNYGTVSRFLCPRGSNHVFKHIAHIYLVNYQAVGSYCRSEVVFCHFAIALNAIHVCRHTDIFIVPGAPFDSNCRDVALIT